MRYIIAFCLVLLIAGCDSLTKKLIEAPKVDLNDVSVTDVGLQGATLVFGVRVQNPNSFALKVDSVKYDVDVAGKNVGSGRLAKGAQVGAKETGVIHIPVPVLYKDVFSSVMDLFKKGTTDYRFRGEAKVGPLSLPFDHTGKVNLREDDKKEKEKEKEKEKKKDEEKSQESKS